MDRQPLTDEDKIEPPKKVISYFNVKDGQARELTVEQDEITRRFLKWLYG